MTESLLLSAVPESPGRARRFVSSWLEQWGYSSLVERAELVTSELATNAVAHAGQPFTVALEDLGDGVHITVRDPVPHLPVSRAASHLESSGRGMQIVEALASSWGATLVPGDGKLVWCNLR
ncbi:MAG: ATP-binding protein [Actinobacteria bacterium]|nr:ATP-binding protein [Actinomycetota bacterium]